jgi:hypothetical protein
MTLVIGACARHSPSRARLQYDRQGEDFHFHLFIVRGVGKLLSSSCAFLWVHPSYY